MNDAFPACAALLSARPIKIPAYALWQERASFFREPKELLSRNEGNRCGEAEGVYLDDHSYR